MKVATLDTLQNQHQNQDQMRGILIFRIGVYWDNDHL